MAKNNGVATASTVDELLDTAEERATEEAEPRKFNLVRFITNKGVVMPEDKVEIYLNVAKAREIWLLEQEREELVKQATVARDKQVADLIHLAWQDESQRMISDEDPMDAVERLSKEELELPARAAEIDAKLPVLRGELLDSRVIFHLRGVPPAVMKAIEKKITATVKHSDPEVQEDRRETFRGVEMCRLATYRVEVPDDPEMNMDGTLSHSDMQDILDNLPPTELSKIMNNVQFLTYAGILVDPKVDAGFPGGRDEPSGEPVDSGDDQGGTPVDD